MEKFTYFLESDTCPNFIKADVKQAKEKKIPEEDFSQNNNSPDDDMVQPEWMETIRPNPNFDDPQKDVSFDDGGPDHDWCEISNQYPEDFGKDWWNNISKSTIEDDKLNIPSVDSDFMNEDQLLAFKIIMNTLSNFHNQTDKYKPLRMIVSGSAGSGKSFLIKCLVKSIRLLFHSNKSVQVLCPTGNSANLISGVTLHSFLKIPTFKRGGEMRAPDGSLGENLQTNCSGLHAILVDERSLIGSTTLGWMDFHCRCGTGILDQTWGGIPVVVFFWR